jgi:hypothetical protein
MQDCTTTANGDNLESLSNVQNAEPHAHAEDGVKQAKRHLAVVDGASIAACFESDEVVPLWFVHYSTTQPSHRCRALCGDLAL